MTRDPEIEMQDAISESIERMDSAYELLFLTQDKFKSGNDIPVERITLTRAEIEEISKRILK